MPDLSFEVTGVEAATDAVTPVLSFALRISSVPADEPIQTILLRCQVRIEAPRRKYAAEEKEQLRDLFGEPERWGSTLRPLLWTNASLTVPAFTGATTQSVDIPCTCDLNAGVSKYFHALHGGDVPLTFLFSGSIFYEGPTGLQVAPVSWSTEARFRLQVSAWKELLERCYPHSAWLCVERRVLDKLYRFKVREGLPDWEHAIELLLASDERARGVPV